jgi:heme/copper-type cytochrome/quinol oxidase subunit 3
VERSAVTAVISSIAATTMLMAALTSAYIVRRGLGSDWQPVHLPLVVPGGVLLLVLSSVALEIGRRAHKAYRHRAFVRAWFAGIVLGAVFVLAQVYGWQEISRAGLSMGTSPAAAFLFVITGLFVALVIGTLTLLVSGGLQMLGGNPDTGQPRVAVARYYWHYLDCLWIYLLILFYLRS